MKKGPVPTAKKTVRHTSIMLFAALVLFVLNNTPVSFFENMALFLLHKLGAVSALLSQGLCVDIEKLQDLAAVKAICRDTGIQLRGFIYFALSMFLAIPFIRELAKKFRKNDARTDLIISIVSFVILAIAYLPVIKSMGLGHYVEYSEDPFGTVKPFSGKRLLVPFIANMLFCRGYLLYNLFSVVLIVATIFFLKRWFTEKNIKITPLNFLSVLTSSFMIFHFQYTGYVDILVFLLFIILTTYTFDVRTKLAVLTLALLTHEASIFIIIPYIIFMVPKAEKKYCISLLILYLFTYTLFSKTSLPSLYEHHAVISGASSMAYLSNNISRAVWGILIAYKLLWCYIFMALYRAWRSGALFEMMKVFFFIFAPFIMLNMVDTSRLIGYGFLGLLFSLSYLHQKKVLDLAKNNMMFLGNLLIPSFYCGLNTGIVFPIGLYGGIVWLLTNIPG